ncbi:hypothetical protein Ancab_015085 [Ancistrocladus abbreviatus]
MKDLKMVQKGRIAQYRERLDKTLASHDLTDEEMLKTLVKDQLLRSEVECEDEGSVDNVLPKRTAELSNLLEMLRSAADNCDKLPHKTPHASWKLKQDNEEFRVMYREGPLGSPFHTLLVEGYVDAPLDACLCVSWETALYPTWFPETRIPTFKVTTAKCLWRVQIGEQISLVRVKLSWPVSNREAVLQYFEFEYFKDGLIIVVLNTPPDVESIQRETDGFSNDEMMEVGHAVRIDLVGGFALQKVTDGRSYFRTIANLDIKLDFVPPSLINFISRQLIGSGFKHFQKSVASISNGDKNFSKALNDPLYKRIREAIYLEEKPKRSLETGIAVVDTCNIPEKNDDILQEEFQNDDQLVHSGTSPKHEQGLHWTFSPKNEIEEEDVQEHKNLKEDTQWKIAEQSSSRDSLGISHVNNKKVQLSPAVEVALGTLEKAISVVRQAKLNGEARAEPDFISKGSERVEGDKHQSSAIEDHEPKLSAIEDLENCSGSRVLSESSKQNIIERVSDNGGNSFNLHSSRGKGMNSYSKELNPCRIAPVSLGVNLPSASESPQVASQSTETSLRGKTVADDNGINSDANCVYMDMPSAQKKSGQPKKWRFCCLHMIPGRLVSS